MRHILFCNFLDALEDLSVPSALGTPALLSSGPVHSCWSAAAILGLGWWSLWVLSLCAGSLVSCILCVSSDGECEH